jgi:hypothetical protein
MHLEYQQLIQNDPDLEARLEALPRSIFSTRESAVRGRKGVFLCYSLPALDKETGEFTEAAGSSGWYLYEKESGKILSEPGEIVGSIRAAPETPRNGLADSEEMATVRRTIEKHIKNIYLKRVQAPIGVKPVLKAWMEIS